MDLTTFLLARVAEDEAAARAVQPLGHNYDMGGKRQDERHYVSRLSFSSADGAARSDQDEAATQHFRRHDPARVLAQCEAVKRIVALHDVGNHTCEGMDVTTWLAPCDTLLALAAIWQDHPDFDPAWRAEVGA